MSFILLQILSILLLHKLSPPGVIWRLFTILNRTFTETDNHLYYKNPALINTINTIRGNTYD